jgi:hypothetical protein
MSANISGFHGFTVASRNRSADPNLLAAALRRGATVYIGPHSDPVDLTGLKSLFEEAFPFDDDYRHYQLIGPTVTCAQFGFTHRRRRSSWLSRRSKPKQFPL